MINVVVTLLCYVIFMLADIILTQTLTDTERLMLTAIFYCCTDFKTFIQ